jgi:hypothetical protein
MTMSGARRGPFPWAWYLKTMLTLTGMLIAAVVAGVHFGWLH